MLLITRDDLALLGGKKTLWLSLLLIFVLAACRPAGAEVGSQSSGPESITFCVSAVSPLQLPLWYATEKGLFEPYDLQVDLVQVANGSTAAAAMIAGEVDACQIAASNIVNAVAAGEELALIGGLYDRHVYSLMVREGINEADDLVGKRVAVTRPGTATDTSLRVALEHLGLDADEDVAIVSAGGLKDIHDALVAGGVDGGIEGVPLSILAKRAGFHEMLNLSELPYPYQHLVIAVRRQLVEEEPGTALNIMRAITEGMQLMQDDRDGTKEVLAQYLGYDLETDNDLLDEIYEVVVKQQMQPVPFVSRDGVAAVIEIASEVNPQAAELQPEDVAAFEVMEQLEASGFLSSLAE